MKTLAEKVLEKAQEKAHLANLKSSADICISDAKFWIGEGNQELACYRALKALVYSVGVFSDCYKNLKKQVIGQYPEFKHMAF